MPLLNGENYLLMNDKEIINIEIKFIIDMIIELKFLWQYMMHNTYKCTTSRSIYNVLMVLLG